MPGLETLVHKQNITPPIKLARWVLQEFRLMLYAPKEGTNGKHTNCLQNELQTIVWHTVWHPCIACRISLTLCLGVVINPDLTKPMTKSSLFVAKYFWTDYLGTWIGVSFLCLLWQKHFIRAKNYQYSLKSKSCIYKLPNNSQASIILLDIR